MKKDEMEDIILELQYLKEWINANSRRLDYLEANAFFLDEHEEVLLITVPKKMASTNKSNIDIS
jgi:hypothetical protein